MIIRFQFNFWRANRGPYIRVALYRERDDEVQSRFVIDGADQRRSDSRQFTTMMLSDTEPLHHTAAPLLHLHLLQRQLLSAVCFTSCRFRCFFPRRTDKRYFCNDSLLRSCCPFADAEESAMCGTNHCRLRRRLR